MYEHFLLLHLLTCLLWIIPGCGLLIAWYCCIINHQNQQSHRQFFLTNYLTPGTTITTITGQEGIILVVLQHSVIIEKPTGEKVEIFKHAISTDQNNAL